MSDDAVRKAAEKRRFPPTRPSLPRKKEKRREDPGSERVALMGFLARGAE